MGENTLWRQILAACFALATAATATAQIPINVRVVDRQATGVPIDGRTWETAFRKLQDGLADMNPPSVNEIWVAAATYSPDVGFCDINNTFQLIDGVGVYGGFLGTSDPSGGETERSQRNPESNVTILDGELDGCLPVSYTKHVITACEVDDETILSGFTITNGQATRFDTDGLSGGGMLIINGSPVVTRCIFVDNLALGRGGGVHVKGVASRAQFVNCSFIGNSGGTGRGGGIAVMLCAEVILVNCLFSGNSAGSGGGLYCESSGFCTRPVELTNCTFSENSAGLGGAIRARFEFPLSLTNCIAWYNSPDQISFLGENGFPVITFSNIQGGGWQGEGNIGEDPILHDPNFCLRAGLDSTPGTLDDNLRLLDGSPSIDTGSDAAVPPDSADVDDNEDPMETLPWDTDKQRRIFDGLEATASDVDMGAYENQHVDGCPWDTGDPDTSAPPDGMVATQDLLYLLRNWGSCPGCAADFNCDLAVGTGDLLAFLVNWGCCPNEPGCNEPLTLAQELALRCLDQDDWNVFMDCLETGTPEEQENCNCWMIHLLDHCSNCFICQHTPECPGPNPFE